MRSIGAATLLAALAIVAASAACGDDGAPAGVCCPLVNPCSLGGNGGWAPSADKCETGQGFDGEFRLETDTHGCLVWVGGGPCTNGQMCCTVGMPPDAGMPAR